MAQITLRPDLKTSGGEVCDITLDGRYVGTMALIIREGHRVAGSIQLDQDSLSEKERKEAISFVQQYIEQTVAAVHAEDCEVVVTCSSFDQIIVSENQVGVVKEFLAADEDSLLEDEDIEDEDEDEYGYEDVDELLVGEADEEDLNQVRLLRDPSQYELAIVGESRNRVEYHIYDLDGEWIAEVFLQFRGAAMRGEINWIYEPLEQEIEQVVELVLSDFDDDEIDTIRLDMLFEGELLETLELAHEDLIDEDDVVAFAGVFDEDADEFDEEDEDEDDFFEAGTSGAVFGGNSLDEAEYSIVLARDDGEALTYEIYEHHHGGLPVGRATVDISERGLSGFIEFRDSDCSEDREQIGALLMQELDKEKDYDSIHLTMLLHNRPIDEILYETEQLH